MYTVATGMCLYMRTHSEKEKERKTVIIIIKCNAGRVGEISVLFSFAAAHLLVFSPPKFPHSNLKKEVVNEGSRSASFLYIFTRRRRRLLTSLHHAEVRQTGEGE